MKNIISVDVEEWFHPEALQERFPRDTWDRQPQRVRGNMEKLLGLFEEKGIKATFFTLGWVAQKDPQIIKDIVSGGHELASHGSYHRMVTKMTPEEFREDLKTSLDILQDISGEKVLGFRAPTFSVVKETFWSLEIMAELGLRYDSSVYPIWHDRYGVPDAPRKRYVAFEKNGLKLDEFPMSTMQWFGKNMPFGGGGYLRIFPNAITRMGIRKMNRENLPAIMYMHPWEFDAEQPRLNLGRLQSWRHYYNIDKNLEKLAQLLDAFEWGPFRDHLN